MITAIVPVLNGLCVKIKDRWYEIDIATLTTVLNKSKDLVVNGKTLTLAGRPGN
jgi:hypothetical protein